MQLQQFDPAAFLCDTWQQRPLLIRNPWTAWTNPLEPDDLAGLACENDVESRLVRKKGKTWSLEHGPISAKRFAKLGSAPWTLLVQAVDHHVPEVAALMDAFRFIPNWRIDDVMVSYATDGGGVGPHFDQYDVFLVQGLGRRRWQVGAPCDEGAALLPHEDLRLLAQFEATDEWVLEPGDILYVPPRFAHNGVAEGHDCMTYSIGFRAPSRRELIAAWCDEVVARLPDDDRYADPGLALQENPGEIRPQALAQLQAMISEKLGDPQAFAKWFGGYVSAPRYPDVDWTPDAPLSLKALRKAIGRGATLCRNPASRFSFIAEGADEVLLFVDGQRHACRDDATPLARQLCAEDGFALDAGMTDAALELIKTLHDQGSVAFED